MWFLVQGATASNAQIDATADRVLVDPDHARVALSVVDVKHAQEANPSYESEAVLYAVLLANSTAGDDRRAAISCAPQRGRRDMLARTIASSWRCALASRIVVGDAPSP